MYKYIQISTLILFYTACTPNLAPIELVKWVENEKNGFRHKQVIDDVVFTLQERPLEYMLCLENQGNVTREQIESVNSSNDLLHFYLDIRPNNESVPLLMYKAENKEEYFDRLRYYTTEVQSDIMLINFNDTLYPVLSHFEQSYNMAPNNILTFAFEKPLRLDKKFKIIFHDRVFQNGPIEFLIETTKKHPKLKLP